MNASLERIGTAFTKDASPQKENAWRVGAIGSHGVTDAMRKQCSCECYDVDRPIDTQHIENRIILISIMGEILWLSKLLSQVVLPK